MLLQAVVVAFSMFSAIPMPEVSWTPRAMRYSLCAFPLIGVVIALACFLWQSICRLLLLPAILRGAVLCLIPVLITGGIHLDGYADTCDARSSHLDPEKRQEILKDPHIGTFAVIRLCMYFLLDFALWTALPDQSFGVLLGIFCLSRALSGLSLTLFPLRPGSGLARSFAEAADRRKVQIFLLCLTALLALMLLLLGTWEILPAAALVFLLYRRVCRVEFGGLSGDLAGWFLQRAELWMTVLLLLRSAVRASL